MENSCRIDASYRRFVSTAATAVKLLHHNHRSTPPSLMLHQPISPSPTAVTKAWLMWAQCSQSLLRVSAAGEGRGETIRVIFLVPSFSLWKREEGVLYSECTTAEFCEKEIRTHPHTHTFARKWSQLRTDKTRLRDRAELALKTIHKHCKISLVTHTCTQRDHKTRLFEPKPQVSVRTKSGGQCVKLRRVNIDLEAGQEKKEMLALDKRRAGCLNETSRETCRTNGDKRE